MHYSVIMRRPSQAEKGNSVSCKGPLAHKFVKNNSYGKIEACATCVLQFLHPCRYIRTIVGQGRPAGEKWYRLLFGTPPNKDSSVGSKAPL